MQPRDQNPQRAGHDPRRAEGGDWPSAASDEPTTQLPRPPQTGQPPRPAGQPPRPIGPIGQPRGEDPRYPRATQPGPPVNSGAPWRAGVPPPNVYNNDRRSPGPDHRDGRNGAQRPPYEGPARGAGTGAGGDIRPASGPRRPAPRGAHLPPYSQPFGGARVGDDDAQSSATGPRMPRKLTVTRVAALRSRELTTRGVHLFQRAATADGADRSGLTHLTYAVMANYAVDAAVAVALANTLFFAAATAESTGKVLLYLLITVAPFALIAPFIGPALDRVQRGRRIALATSSFTRAVLALILAFNFHSWVLYPCALGMLVLSKSFGVLKAALTPRVLPEQITLVKTNSRLTVFGMVAGGVSGAVAAGLIAISTSMGVLIFTAALCVAGGLLCLRIPAWVESTEGEIPVLPAGATADRRRAFPHDARTALWANGTIRVETGFLALFIAFVVKSEFSHASGLHQLGLLGAVGVAAGIGGFIGNALGARLPLDKPDLIANLSLVVVLAATIVAVLAPGMITAVLLGLIGSGCSSLAKVCLDSTIQHGLPEASRASAFGRSESVLQLCWVLGGVVGLLLGGVWRFPQASVYSIGFGVLAILLAVGTAQSWLVRAGHSAFARLRGWRRGGRDPARPDLGATAPTTAPTVGADSAVTGRPPRRRTRRAGKPR